MPSSISRTLRHALDSRAGEAILRVIEQMDHGRGDLLAVLTYHRVAPPGNVAGFPGLVSETPAGLEEQMGFVARRCRVVALEDVLEAREARRPIGPRAVLLTFDDAHRDFADHAWPVARRHGVPAALFVPTAFPDDPTRWFWWDWLYESIASAPDGLVLETERGRVRLDSDAHRMLAFRRLRDQVRSLRHEEAIRFVREVAGERLGRDAPPNPVLTWPELEELGRDGVTLAPHSRTHPLLTQVDDDRLRDEVLGSAEDLRGRAGSAITAFAYPSGAWSSRARDAVERAGYRLAFTTRRGLNRLGKDDWLTLRRINVGGMSSLNVLRAQLGRWALAWSR